MIKKVEIITNTEPQTELEKAILRVFNGVATKLNEVVDAVNELQEFCDVADKNLAKLMEEATRAENVQPDTESRQENVQKPYDEQRWVGCLCKLWTGDGLVRYGILRGVALNRKKTNYPYQALSTSFEHCEPVKPDDDIIYKGDDNEL